MRILDAVLMRRLKRAAIVVRKDIVVSFQKTPKQAGKRVSQLRVGPGQLLHERSKPGEPPAIQTGTLRRAMTYEVGKDIQGPVARVGPMSTLGEKSLKYARFLEFGTRKMRARPFLRPAFARKARDIALILGGRK